MFNFFKQQNKPRTILRIVFLLPILLVTSCSTQYTDYQGGNIMQGSGGAIRTVDGVDIWSDGSPNREYQITGVLDDVRGRGIISDSTWGSDLAKAAKKHGGDAIIISQQGDAITGFDGYGNVYHDHRTKAFVIKYVDESAQLAGVPSGISEQDKLIASSLVGHWKS